MSDYPNTLKYYMWGYQVHFRISCQTRCESIFSHFDRGLFPNVYILGLLKDGVKDKPSLCFEPEEIEHLKSYFDGLGQRADTIHQNDPDRNMFYSGPGVQEKMDVRLKNNSIRKAIEDTLNELPEGKDNIFFVSKHVSVNDYYVFVVLSLNREVYNSHTHLSTRFFNERYRIYRSILETSVDLFLADCETKLYLPSPGESLGFETKSTEEIRIEAARSFMYTVSSKGQDGMGLHGLFDACNNISIHRYEGKENIGQIFVTSKDDPYIEYTLRLEEPFSLHDFRKTRKMLQLTNDSIGVISNSHQVLGLGKIKTDYDISSETIFTIKFRGIHCWEVWHGNQAIIIMRYGQPHFPSEIIGKSKFSSDCKRLFKQISDEQIENLYQLSVTATKQKNGALLVITTDAKGEAHRLRKQSISITPLKLNEEMLLSLTSIDGGVLVDIDGYAFAQGVILDGIVSDNGDSARGSRYNSAVTYYDFRGKQYPTLIVVVSEDGMVDIIPYLRPQIRRSEVTEVISILEGLKAEYDTRTFNRIMEWFRNREFYLSKEQCKYINKLRGELEERDFEGVRIVHQDLSPNPEMDDSYFIDQ